MFRRSLKKLGYIGLVPECAICLKTIYDEIHMVKSPWVCEHTFHQECLIHTTRRDRKKYKHLFPYCPVCKPDVIDVVIDKRTSHSSKNSTQPMYIERLDMPNRCCDTLVGWLFFQMLFNIIVTVMTVCILNLFEFN